MYPFEEWKPKSSHSNTAVSAVSVEPQPELKTTLPAIASEDSTLELEKKLKDTNLSERKHVVIPNHLQVPEVKKLGFCFGSFDAGFELHMSEGVVKGDFGKTSVLSQPSIPNDEPLKELTFRSESTKLEVEDTDKEYSDHPETTVKPPSTNFERNEPLLEAAQESHQHASHHIPSSYNIGLPPIVSSQVSPLESSESQARDATRVPGFIMQQPFDPASYYAQFYRSGLLDNDGRISPILPAGAVNNYNGNNTAIPSQTSQTHPELQGNEQLVTQAAGVMRSSIPATQQNLPIFRHPSGVHLPHYPPNFIPYGPYFSPFYVPPPAIHQFLGNGMFPPQPQSGSLYPSAPGTSSKYSVAQFKQGSVTGNSTQVGLPGSFGTYGLSMAGFSSTSPSPTVTSSSSDNVAAPYIKENNAYIGVQQNDGSGVWYATPTADVGNVQASTFYNLSQGQMPFNPTGPGHGAYTGMFHPAQGVAPAANIHPILQQSQPITSHVDMVGQTANAYQQQQTNWPSSY